LIDGIGYSDEHGSNVRPDGGWRVVASAWALVLLFLLLLGGVSAVACTRGASHSHRHLAGAKIPHHDACSGSGIPSAHTVDGCGGVPITEDRSAYW